MSIDILTLASGLSDHDLLARLGILAGREREATAELIAHLAALDARPNLYAAHGYGSLFGYCTGELLLSEDATCTRIDVARASRRFPAILGLLSRGALSLAAVRLLIPHLTVANHEEVLARASGRSRRQIEAFLAELAPQPDAPSTVRKLPARTSDIVAVPRMPSVNAGVTESGLFEEAPSAVARADATPPAGPSPVPAPAAVVPLSHRPIIEMTSPERYRVQFTLGKEAHDRLRRLQDLLRREIPNGDPGAIVDRALILLLTKVEKEKLGATAKPRPIRPGTDDSIRTPLHPSRRTPNPVKREVAGRDGNQCGYVAADGRRCTERGFLEFHHVRPYAQGGPATVENISLRCRRHNQYEAQLVFGARAATGDGSTAKPRPPSAAVHGPAPPAAPGTARVTPG